MNSVLQVFRAMYWLAIVGFVTVVGVGIAAAILAISALL